MPSYLAYEAFISLLERDLGQQYAMNKATFSPTKRRGFESQTMYVQTSFFSTCGISLDTWHAI